MNRNEQATVTPLMARTTELTREIIHALVTAEDDAALAARIGPLAAAIGTACEAAAPAGEAGIAGNGTSTSAAEPADGTGASAADPADGTGASAAARALRSDLVGHRSPVTSLRNPLAPPLSIGFEDGRAVGRVVLPEQYEGPPLRVHGGIVGMLLDHVMGSAANTDSPAPALTGRLSVDFHAATPLGEEVEVSGWIERTDGRKLHMVGEVRAGGQLCARATGLWVVLSPEAFAAALAQAGLSAEQFMS